jgi:hypothetical protein
LSESNVQVGPTVPGSIVNQTDDWSCSVRSSYAALWAIAQVKNEDAPLYGWWANIMSAYANPQVGLLDGSGAGLATALRSVGVEAFNLASTTREAVAAYIRGGALVLIGGHNWGPAGHWALANGVEPDGTLTLANPAGSYQGISNLILDSWGRFAPWSAVVIPALRGEPVPEENNMDARVAELEAEVARLNEELAAARNLVGNAYNSDGAVRTALANLISSTKAIDYWLEDNRP